MQKLPVNLAAFGFALLNLDILVGWVLLPFLFNSQIANQVKLKNGTEVWDKWLDVPVPVFLGFYIFNVTNPEEVGQGAKPILQEKGPYVYREKKIKTEISVSDDEEYVTYRQPAFYFFEEEMSAGTEDDILTVINVPFVVVTHMAEKAPSWLNYLIHLYITSFEEELFIKKTVGELLFKGYHQPLMADIEAVTGQKILHEKKFGLYYPKNGTDDGLYKIHSGIKNTNNFGVIKSWNNKTKLDWWVPSEGDYCNMLNGTDGTIFPPFLTKDRVLYIYNPDLCRSLYLTFEEETEFAGIPGYRFSAPPSMLQDPFQNGNNKCFCTEPGKNMEKCPKAGTLSLSSCRDGAPLTASAPHFYQGAQIYVNQSIGLNPTKELHGTFVDFEPKTAITMNAHRRLQFNVELKKRPLFEALVDVPDMLFPVFWADLFAEMDDASIKLMKGRLVTPLYIIDIVKWTVLGIGLTLIAASVIMGMFRLRRKAYHV